MRSFPFRIFIAAAVLAVIAPFANAQSPAPVLPVAQSAAPPTPPAGKIYEAIRPSATDPAIRDFDDPHWVYAQPEIVINHDPALPADRHELLLWLPGTRPPHMATPLPGHLLRAAPQKFCLLAASLGYRVIALSYPNALPAAFCNGDADPAAFEKFRMAIIEGGTSPRITVSRADSIENRLVKLLQLLAKDRPREDWGQFLDDKGNIRWEKIAVAGHSQGGGHAALIGIHHRVARVLSFGAPKDYSTALGKPAAWYSEQSATPKELFFTFNHEQDFQGCTPAHLQDNLRALKLDQLGAPVLVENASPPFQNTRILMTNWPGTPVNSQTAHGTMIDSKNSALFDAAWRYMLTK